MEPSKVVQQLFDAERPKRPGQSYQFWADRFLGQLSILYPWHRFLIVVGETNAGNTAVNVQNGAFLTTPGE
uniref:Uncharacterized protein n=1 Tax=Globodera rostochiensis TaxID=31243 RepID=A0A914I436_GLORO